MQIRSHYYLVRYEIADGAQEHHKEIMVEALSRASASEYILAHLQETYGDDAVLLSLDISPHDEPPPPELPAWIKLD